MKLFAKILLSLLVGGSCIALALRKIDLRQTATVLRDVSLTTLVLYAVSLAPVHLLRAWRWKYLLRPIGVSLSFKRLVVISTVGFMAILALPFRLGEFARPYYAARETNSRMSAVLGTVAVERIVDGLVIALMLFAAYLYSFTQGQHPYPAVLAASAWAALLGFLALTAFLGCALRFTEPTIRLVLTVTFLDRISPRLAEQSADKLRSLIQGFRALHNARDLLPFLLQTALYWGANGLGMWLLALRLGLPIPVQGAFAAMAFTGVLITLPNAPGLVGQFHAGILLALTAYLPASLITSVGGAYAIALHGIQFAWYVAFGFLALLFIGESPTSLRSLVMESKRAAEQGGK
ncbi:MAG: lysylphosphatidylglycerol synthase transmembrane domain-containing protein [Polyangia bacterium]